MKVPKPQKIRKAPRLPKADLSALASAMHAALALANTTGERPPASLAQNFYALLEAELAQFAPATAHVPRATLEG